MLHDLKLRFQIDTVTLAKSSVTYDEFPVEGQKAGEVSFNSLRATILNVSNISNDPMSMNTSARFMNAGNLDADFTFPSNPEKPYTIAGKLTDFNMPEINRILIPIANAEVKTGKLHSMQFNYQYNEYRSDGLLTMHYSDLDVASLIKGSKDKETNKFLTLILQKFIIKKDMDKAKSQGTILYYHDPERSTFNFWWKSILSGVKSLYNLDKITDTHHSKKK